MNYHELIKNHPNLFSNDDALFRIITNKEEIKNWEQQKSEIPKKYRKIGVVYEDQYICILRDLVYFPSGRIGTYFRLVNQADFSKGTSVAVLAKYQNRIVLLNQFRHATRSWHLEAPRGFGESNIPPEENAKNEIADEIHGEIESLLDLGPYHSNTGIEGVRSELFLANLSSIGRPNEDEGIKDYKLFDINEVEKMISNSQITDGFTIAAYSRAKFRNLI
ncbi:MAG TPA: hypothetical protein DIW44_12340 [Anaerolineaceae bacterium]|nr:hypothetical protein [Anaerolineaceae bacterium]